MEGHSQTHSPHAVFYPRPPMSSACWPSRCCAPYSPSDAKNKGCIFGTLMGGGERMLIHGRENAITPIRRYNFWGARHTPDAASFVVGPIGRRLPPPTVLLWRYLGPFKRYSALSGDTARHRMVSTLASLCLRFIWSAKSGE